MSNAEQETRIGQAFPFSEHLEDFRSYLLYLARKHLDQAVQGKLAPSDLVQQTLVQALEDAPRFRGSSDAQIAAWLRCILANLINNARRDLNAGKRDVKRERSLEEALTASSVRLMTFLVANQPSPSERAEVNEQTLRLTQALEDLPERQREAVTLHYLHDWTVDQLASHLNCTAAAVGGLLKRGLSGLRMKLAKGG
jgi:RNA polymerase sigma-70 factor (ECF subfamily)